MTKRRESRGPGLAAVLAAMCVFVCAQNADAQAPASTTWSVSIVLPAKLVAGQPATLAVLGTDGRLAEGITVDLGEDQRVKTDASGRVTFTVRRGMRFMMVNAQGPWRRRWWMTRRPRERATCAAAGSKCHRRLRSEI